MTASAWVVNPARDRVLMVYHKIYDSWSWTGGHADGDEDLPAVALREVREETGVQSARLVSDEILSLEVLTVDGHEKRGEYVSSHLHLNVTYLIEADERDALTVCEEENRRGRWPPRPSPGSSGASTKSSTRGYRKSEKAAAFSLFSHFSVFICGGSGPRRC